jgi:hypothetical protein
LFFRKPLNHYFLELLRNDFSSLNALRIKFDLKKWEACEELLKTSVNGLLNMFSDENEALMSALMLFEFVLCLEKKYTINYEKTLTKARPDIIFQPIIPEEPAVIHENKIVLSYKFTKDIVARKK